MTFQLGAKKVKKKPLKDSVRTETNKKMESTNKTKMVKNREVQGIRTIIMRLGEIGKREAISAVWTLKAEKIICETSSMMTSLSLETKIITEEMEEDRLDNKEGAEEIEGEVMEEEDIEVAHQCKKMEEGQVVVTEAATSMIGETVATKDLWIIIMAHHTE